MLAVFVEGGCANRAQFTTRKLRLHDIGSIRCALGRAGADQRVQLIDEQDDFAFAGNNLLEESLQAIFEFATILGSGDHGPQIHRDQSLVFEGLRDVATDDSARHALRNRRFSNARLADEDRIVLRAPGQHLHHAPDFFVAPNDRVDLSLSRQGSKVTAIFLQCLKFVFGVWVSHALITAQVGQCAQDGVAFQSLRLEELFQRRASFIQEAQQQMLRANVVVFELLGLSLSGIQHLLQVVAEKEVARTDTLDFVAALKVTDQLGFQLRSRNPDLFEKVGNQAILLLDHRQQEMLAINFLMRITVSDPLRFLQRFLGLNGQLLQLHILNTLGAMWSGVKVRVIFDF